jgi:hypothetical protein
MRVFPFVKIIAFCFVLVAALAAVGQVTALPPYTVSTFATSVTNVYFQPDSIAVRDNHIFVGFGNNAAPDGSDGKSSTIVEYDFKGNVISTYSVVGHNDGLKLNPSTKQIWAMQNEDANPNLVIIDPETRTQTKYTFGPTPHGGGYDDIAFRGNDVFFSASNPSNNPNNFPAIVRGTINGRTISVSPVLLGTAPATDIPTNTPVSLNLQDPDSMKFNAFGDLVLDSQADAELIIVHHAGAVDQSVYHLGLTLSGAAAQIDDTVYAFSPQGVLLVSDRDGETVYSVSRNIFAPFAAYSAAPTSVAELDLSTGVLTNAVTGMVSPHGMAYIRDGSGVVGRK